MSLARPSEARDLSWSLCSQVEPDKEFVSNRPAYVLMSRENEIWVFTAYPHKYRECHDYEKTT